MKINRFKKTYTLWKDFSFEAAHSLKKVPAWHQCKRLHGHSYKIRVHFSGLITAEHDWLVDYGEVSTVVKPFIAKLDHQNLNSIFEVETTAENIAWWFSERLHGKIQHLSGVEVFETPTTSVMIHL